MFAHMMHADRSPAFAMRPKIPHAALGAVILWFSCSATSIVATLVILRDDPDASARMLVYLVLPAIAAMLALSGRIPGLFWAGLASLSLAVLGLWLVVAAVFAHGTSPALWRLAMLSLHALMLAAAGILAMVGNRSFEAWRVQLRLARQRRQPPPPPPGGCPSCAGPLRFDQMRRAWYCNACHPAPAASSIGTHP